MTYIYSKHAEEQLSKRSISKEKVADVIAEADKIIMHDSCLKIYQKVYVENGNRYLYRIFVKSLR